MANENYPVRLTGLVLSLALAWPAFAAQLQTSAQAKPEHRTKLPAEIQPLADLAQSAPPEFAADAFLRIVESNKISDRRLKQEILEQAFRLAASAQHRLKLRSIAGTPPDTPSGSLNNAYNLRLDALSLQCRAVRQLLPLDKRKARELFSEIPKPILDPLRCEDALVFDVADFYETLIAVVQSAFTPEETRREDHIGFLLSYVYAVSSSTQLAPVARMIRETLLTPSQRELAAAAFTALLEKTAGDYRSFSSTMSQLESELEQLAQSLKQQGLGTAGLIGATRKYLVGNLHAARCDDGGLAAGTRIEPDYAAWFNKFQLQANEVPAALPLITPSETQSEKFVTSDKVPSYWQTPEAKSLLEGGMKLRFGAQPASGEPQQLSERVRLGLDWKREASDFLNKLTSWKASQGTSETDFYQQKNVIYQALLELAPAGDDRDKLIENYVQFVSSSPVQQESRIQWFWPVRTILERVRGTNGGEPNKLLDAFERSGNVVLALYAREEKMLTPGRPSWAVADGQN